MQHLSEKDFKESIMYTQNLSALIFFIVVHLPLSKISCICSFLTAMLVWLLDYKTKANIYHLVAVITRLCTDRKAAYAHFKKLRKTKEVLELGRGNL